MTSFSTSIADVLEKAGGEQGLDRLGSLFVVQRIADLDRQIAENRTGFRALNTLDPDVLDCKRFECQRGGSKHAGNQDGQQGFFHRSAVKQAGQVVKKGESHQGEKNGHADLLSNLHGRSESGLRLTTSII
jgi:hypothetical protein